MVSPSLLWHFLAIVSLSARVGMHNIPATWLADATRLELEEEKVCELVECPIHSTA